MQKIEFVKMVAAGNDFVVSEAKSQKQKAKSLSILAKNICDRKFGAGADGLLWLEKSRKADLRMRIFNADGSEAEMCGNGARCAALYKVKSKNKKAKIKLETKAGIIDSEINGDKVRIKLTAPKSIKLDVPVKVGGRQIRVNFINTGVPHAVVFTQGLEKIDILPLGRLLRYHKDFSPRGTNVDFIEILSRNSIRIRTYERGVEDETLACGTGSVAAALIFSLKTGCGEKVLVHTQSNEILKVYFKKSGERFMDVWLEGKSKKAYEGAYYV
jgi:diaminopimelate epimerase